MEAGCVLWGICVLVLEKLQHRVREMLHKGHLGIVRMKALARSYLWWPGLDRELGELAKACTQCQKEQSSPAVAPLHPWSWPTRPWARIHLDFAGPFQGRIFLVTADAHSKWSEVVEMSTTTATQTVAVLRKMFAANGLLEQLVSDNGPQFVSGEFAANSTGSNTFDQTSIRIAIRYQNKLSHIPCVCCHFCLASQCKVSNTGAYVCMHIKCIDPCCGRISYIEEVKKYTTCWLWCRHILCTI